MTETNQNTIVFLDAVGRTIIGSANESNSTDKYLAVDNPAVVHIVPNPQSGQLQLQILPLFFREFLADKSASTTWKFHRDKLTESVDLVLDFKLTAQYQQIFSGGAVVPGEAVPQNNDDVIRLFDEE